MAERCIPSQVQTAENVKHAVAALDIGTTYSGWAYSLLHENKHQQVPKIYTKHWQSGTITTEKTPTCILIEKCTQEYKTYAFGYEAENLYTILVEEGEYGEGHFFFRNFKMELFKTMRQGLSIDMELEDIDGKKLPAIEVFSLAIQYLSDDLRNEWELRIPGMIKPDEIQWVITVPAIWIESSKQFMRQAAVKAGLPNKRLIIALEPEAASVFCRTLTLERLGDANTMSTLQSGSKYIVVDAGGGTVDMTVHEVVGESGLKEVRAATGGAWGGTRVDEAFMKEMANILGADVMSEFRDQNPSDSFELLRQFETKKRTFDSSRPAVISLPYPLLEVYKNKNEKHFQDPNPDAAEKSARNKLRLNPEVVRAMFQQPVKSITDCIKELLEDVEYAAILMVGGFSESRLLQEAVKSAFEGVKVVVPQNAGNCVLSGAVLFGLNPGIISERVVRYTYGINAELPFNESVHPKSQSVMRRGEKWCSNVFSEHVRKGERVKLQEASKTEYYSPVYQNQPYMSFNVYATEKETPVTVTEPDCFQIGQVRIDMPSGHGDMERLVEVKFIYSGTEIVVEAKDLSSGQRSSTAVDFLA